MTGIMQEKLTNDYLHGEERTKSVHECMRETAVIQEREDDEDQVGQ